MLKTEGTTARSEELIIGLIRKTLVEVAARNDIPIESGLLSQALADSKSSYSVENFDDSDYLLMRAARGIGIRLAPVDVNGSDIWELVTEGFTVIALDVRALTPSSWLFTRINFGRMDLTCIPNSRDAMESESITKRRLIIRVNALVQADAHFFVAEPSLTCDEASSRHSSTNHANTSHQGNHGGGGHGHGHGDDHHHEHLSPLNRFFRLLRVEKNDIWLLTIFGFVVGVLDLATPLAIEQMVTTIGFSSMAAQPLFWLALLLFGVLSLSAAIKALQYFVIEILQRRILVRIVGDLCERFPRLDRSAIRGVHGPEMANRFFDVMSIQKATSTLLVEGLFLVIQTTTGMVLLAVYSPFLLLYDVVLVFCMTLLLLALGRNAIKTSIEESITKYKIAHWLQDVIGSPKAFQVHGAMDLVSDRANRFTVEYLSARRKHFIILIRQTLFALMLYAVALTSILSLGLWLVISKSLSVGQLVASVSVIALVVGAFAKVGKALESFYDLMASMDKVGHLLDLPTLPPSRTMHAGIGPADVRIENIRIACPERAASLSIDALRIASGERFAICGGDQTAELLMLALCGLSHPIEGLIEIGGVDSRDVNRFADGSMVSIASTPEIFHGSLQENVSLNRAAVSPADVRDALVKVGLWNEVLSMPNGVETILQTGGFPLSQSQAARLMIARAIAGKPRLLLIDGVLDVVSSEFRESIWAELKDRKQPWTLIIATHEQSIVDDCDGKFEVI
ncbi:MAG: ABC transporter transmembrane domain-containing protein [Pirellula sp.]|jgi:putative ABC transport system ATP-binding protein